MKEVFRIKVDLTQPDGADKVDIVRDIAGHRGLFPQASENTEGDVRVFNVDLAQGCERGLETLIDMCGEPAQMTEGDTVTYVAEM